MLFRVSVDGQIVHCRPQNKPFHGRERDYVTAVCGLELNAPTIVAAYNDGSMRVWKVEL